MPDRRRHRGPHPADAELFAAGQVATLRRAVADLSWLLGRGYSEVAAVALVGDRHALAARQRLAVRRCACSDAAVVERRRRQLSFDRLAGETVRVDGFNCLISVEAALSGGLVLRGRDGAHRDLASVHGSYRKVDETIAAVRACGERLAAAGVDAVAWLLDRPVSNSGRLRALLEAEAEAAGWALSVELHDDPDRVLDRDGAVVATSDGVVLDRCGAWVDLPGAVVAELSGVWCLELGAGC